MRNARQTAARGGRRPTPRRTGASPATAAAGHLALAADRVAGALGAMTVKRALDLVLGSALLLLVTPALTLGALALALRPRLDRKGGRADDRKGVLSRELRVGLGGHSFELRSLRTRRLRLDLLSRLPHVVRGDLSLVGPAPLTPGETAALGAAAGRWRHALRPGLTGLAQVRARSGMPWDEPALLDAHYAEHHGTGPDLAILAHSARIALQAAVRGLRLPGKAHLSDTDHRLPGYSVAE
ncbi:sugar transferase [Streptomyces sp. NPDC056749]|uniref:sugar transferase n=1 Tax=Streptomyces sp. NPDC056749 TaxID=3345936 RepID=UPI00369BB485